ncbi:LPS export ABC transporter periplasmic protein LptC [Marinobacter sp. CHS3-4]|uniref:LPS export ABC transporter periplasmic protein LptC n=1 Tax=Marinobacter sp. CHS3-4 TaxID=3045174 RepID=UPI0024B612DB|nr:LPS export ABC transporter periplasmic protein LptC [Marinobacter sp. CHS3-4]MDI9244931.1 LPS export ABC transporter periplasmic protein LptC [Marinobacter sp. CHS3-4]
MNPDFLTRNPRLRNLALAITVIALVAVLWQSDETAEPSDAAALRGEAEPDAFVVGGQFLSFDETGHLTNRIESQRVEQFESDQLTRMQSPRATLFGKAGEASWKAEADQGQLKQAQELMELSGNVRIIRLADDSAPLSLSTEALTLNNSDRTIYTDKPVTIEDPLGVTRSTGMKAWIDDRILELNAEVEGRYEIGK